MESINTAILAINKKLDEADPEEDDQEEKLTGIPAMLSGILEQPQIQQAIAGKVVQMIERIGGILTLPAIPAKIAGPLQEEPQRSQPEPKRIPQDQVNKINEALTILVDVDPQLGDHLQKLAAIGSTDLENVGVA